MGKVTGFKEWQRQGPPKRDPAERTGDFREFLGGFSPADAKAQAGRCMDCGVPFCMQGCPLGNRIPDWNDLVWRDRWREAWVALDSTNNFPEFTGRLCPAPCEAACVLKVNQDPVSIEYIEKEIAEKAFASGWVAPRPPARRTGKTVAVVGSGPAGLAAAAQLNRAGHRVTVFEREPLLGGLLRYGIPDFKLEKHIIDRRIDIMRQEGVEFRTNCDIGRDLGWAELKVRHDALVVAIGAEQARDLFVPGRELGGIHFAMDYLRQQNRRVAGVDPLATGLASPSATPIDARDKRVVILGGGDTGSDCLGTAHRQGARSVAQLELLPAPPVERSADNPWPLWPVVYRTSSSQEEGGDRLFGLRTERIVGRDGHIAALEAVQLEVVKGVDGRTELKPVAGAPIIIPCDLLILAMGFTNPVAERLANDLGVRRDGRGNVAVDAAFRTSVGGVYAAGDARRGASLIVWAIADGRECARTVDADLRGDTSALPTRGADLPFEQHAR
jgi:glutamate synthase (NADPH/NADH) small chain